MKTISRQAYRKKRQHHQWHLRLAKLVHMIKLLFAISFNLCLITGIMVFATFDPLITLVVALTVATLFYRWCILDR